jgi:hypothetical protein
MSVDRGSTFSDKLFAENSKGMNGKRKVTLKTIAPAL